MGRRLGMRWRDFFKKLYQHYDRRIAGILFEGALPVEAGQLRPDRNRPGHGMALKGEDAQKFRG